MAVQTSYRTQTDIQRLEKLRKLEKELPIVCTDFFRSIAQTTSTLTRLAYAYDFRLFFQFLCRENPLFADCEPRFMTEEDFAKVKMRDIDLFQDYLSQYYVSDEETGESHVVQNHELGIMRKLCSLRSLFEYMFKNGIVEANIATLVSLPKVHEKPILRLEVDEMQKMLDAVYSGDGLSEHQKKVSENTKKRDLAIILLFLGTGIRVSECVGINLDDIDMENKAFVVTRKGGDQSMLYMPDSVAEALEGYLDDRLKITPVDGHEDALFLSLQRKRITQRAVQNLVKKYALIAAPLKKRISPHKLRSTFGTNLYEETGDIYLVADVLGHTDVNTTRKHYAAMTDQHKREAARRIILPTKKEE
ncbi:MAG: tyrosine-type recombinase/integrase [Clostridia bacterium]|nr:tyrosine-type recombinase/integrase [Clostridia bacterium]